jgi:hypothetical protein
LDCGSPAAALEKGCLLPQSKAVLDQSIKPTIHQSFPHCNTSDSVVLKNESAASIAALHAFL